MNISFKARILRFVPPAIAIAALCAMPALLGSCKSPVSPPAAIVPPPASPVPPVPPVPPAPAATPAVPDDAGQPDTGTPDATISDTTTERGDDGHQSDRARGHWMNPCWTGNSVLGERPLKEHDGRTMIDLCDVRMPFPESIGFDLDNQSRGVGYLQINGGEWTCWSQDQPEGDMYCCGEAELNDVIYVDIDRDGRREVVAHYMVTYGGNCESYFIFAYEIVEKKPRFKGDLVSERDFYSCEYKSLDRLEPFGKHCVKAVANCDKNCHGCDGTPCYDVFAWTGKGFEIAESWMDANPDNHTEPGTTQDAKLLKLCGI